MTISEILKAKGVADDVIASVLADTTGDYPKNCVNLQAGVG